MELITQERIIFPPLPDPTWKVKENIPKIRVNTPEVKILTQWRIITTLPLKVALKTSYVFVSLVSWTVISTICKYKRTKASTQVSN